ncbi:MAG: heme o synthase [Desulfurococcales archaeon]|nr:heme o synthase [Desulfurococcales archaeon]
MRDKLKAIIELTKPRQLILLLVTMYGAYFAAGGGLDPKTLALLTVAGFGGVGGVTALNMYLEADLDSRMNRTKKRPLPSNRLTMEEAFISIIVMILAGVMAALLINVYVAVALLAGLYFDIITYTELTKRRSIANLILGSVAGSMPALGGWAAAAGGFTPGGIILAGIVFVWQPLHVSALAYYFLDDYLKAGVPVLPAMVKPRTFAILVSASIALLPVLAWLFVAVEGYGVAAAVVTTLMSIHAIIKILRFAESPRREAALGMIKYASPLVAVAFVLLPIEQAIQTVTLLG